MSELARQLWQARRDGTIVRLEDIAEPASTEAAYAVQAEIARLCGHAVRGFKVGSTSAEAQRMLGTTEPGSAPVLAPYLHDSPAEVAIVPLNMPAVEGEFAFRLGRDLPPRPGTYAASEVADAIDAVAGAIEIVGTRIAGGLAGKGRFLMTADGGANVALIIGRWTAAWRGLDLKTHRVAVHINGEARGSGEGARALGDPMAVMVWLANQQSLFGRGLKAGDIVSTGTCTGLDRVRPGDRAVADFGTLGRVEVTVR
jgi:2-keto-4-pentenoate hydratase